MEQSQALTLVNLFQYENQPLRHALIDNEPWFAAKDVCTILEISDMKQASERLSEDERGWYSIPTPGGVQQMICVNESGVYHLIFTSRKPEAQTFRKWVTSEVLPAIRKTGSYSLQGAFDVRELLTMPTREEFNEQIKRLRQIRREMLKALTPRKVSPPKPRKLYAPRQPKPTRTFEEEVMYVLNGLPANTFYSARFISHQTVLLRLVGAPKVRALLNEKTEAGTIAKIGIGKRAAYQLVK